MKRLSVACFRAGCLAVVLGGHGSAAAGPAVPEHSSPWIETVKPDIRTVLFWKFSSAADRQQAAADFLEKAGVEDLLEAGDGESSAGDGPAGDAVEGRLPQLSAGARPVDGGGRFGGGLAVDGRGFAEGRADLPGLLAREGGFTFDGWFRQAAAAAPQTLLAIDGSGGRPLAALVLTSSNRCATVFDGKEVLDVSFGPTADGWHHFTLVVEAGRGPTLAVDATTARAEPAKPEATGGWARLGGRFTVGGGSGQPGLEGVVDEIRLSKGVRHLYPWNLGGQEFPRPPGAVELRAPFFRNGRVLTRLEFDSSLEPVPFAGRSWAGRAGAAQFAAGLQGRSLDLSSIDGAGFSLTGADIVPATDGTIEFWFRPLDWNNFQLGDFHGTDIRSTRLLAIDDRPTAVRAPGGADAAPARAIAVRLGRSGRDGPVRWERIHPGTWSHVLVSMKDGVATVYLNGQAQRLPQVLFLDRPPPLEAGRTAPDGGADVGGVLAFVQSSTLVDEFSVYSWPMSADEAWNAYARWLPDAASRMRPLPAFQVGFDYFAHADDAVARLVATVGCLQVGESRPATVDLEIRNAAGDVLLAAEKRPLDEAGAATFRVDGPLAFGRYPAVVRSRDASGGVVAEERLDYVRERPAWLGNTLGEERTIPAPWKPIRAEGTALEVVGRRIELGRGGLPASIETLGRKLLARPMAMRVAGPGGDAPLTGRGVTFGETAADRVEWKAALAGGGIAAEVEAWLEFDGLLRCTVVLRPAEGGETTIEELDVDVPLEAAQAVHLLANGGGPDFRASFIARTVPGGDGSVWRSSDDPHPAFGRAPGVTNFMPHIWLGADDVGIAFGAENDEGWTIDGPRPAQEIVREGDAVVFRMNVIRESTVIPATGRRFHFFLLPTPAKPEPPDWRRQMVAGGVNFGACDSFGGFDMKTDPSDPVAGDEFRLEPRSWDHAEAMSRESRAKWGRCILYADAAFPRMGPSFGDWNHDLWAGTGRLAWTPECEDYAVWAVNEFLRQGIIDGIYWDDVSVGCTRSLASTAYACSECAGGRRVGFTSLAMRRVNLRLWRLFEAAGREPCIWAHMTACYEVPLFSFCRYLSDGEFVTGIAPFAPRDAIDFWSPEALRIHGTSSRWGAGVSFLTTQPRTMPTGPAGEQWAYPQRRAEDALYATSGIQTLSESLARKLDSEGVYDGPARVYPWWRAAEVARVAAPGKARILAAVHALEDRAIVFLANIDRGVEQEATVELDLATLFPNRRPASAAVAWRDLDPGLDPPAAAAATAAEIAKAAADAARAGVESAQPPLDDESVGDFLEGTSPEERARKRLQLRVEAGRVRVVIRPRDYRVLEARPGR